MKLVRIEIKESVIYVVENIQNKEKCESLRKIVSKNIFHKGSKLQGCFGKYQRDTLPIECIEIQDSLLNIVDVIERWECYKGYETRDDNGDTMQIKSKQCVKDRDGNDDSTQTKKVDGVDVLDGDDLNADDPNALKDGDDDNIKIKNIKDIDVLNGIENIINEKAKQNKYLLHWNQVEICLQNPGSAYNPSEIEEKQEMKGSIITLCLYGKSMWNITNTDICIELKYNSALIVQPILKDSTSPSSYIQRQILPYTHDRIQNIKECIFKKTTNSSINKRIKSELLTLRYFISYKEEPLKEYKACSTITKNITNEILNPEKYEEKYVVNVYNQIAKHFSGTRYRMWPKVKNFQLSLKKNSIILDVGCGNGKYMNNTTIINNNLLYIGCDISIGLLKHCKKNNKEVLIANAINLPFIDNFFDACICIAILHHLASKERRLYAIKEILRTVKSGASIFCTVWAYEQDKISSRRNFKNSDVLVPWNTPQSIANLYNQDEIKLDRYYHVFNRGELASLCMSAGGVDIYETFDRGNWCVFLRKP